MKNVLYKSRRKNKKNEHLYSVTVFQILYRLWDNMEEFCTAGQATDSNMAQARCMPDT
jgi:hypothetical protein